MSQNVKTIICTQTLIDLATRTVERMNSLGIPVRPIDDCPSYAARLADALRKNMSSNSSENRPVPDAASRNFLLLFSDFPKQTSENKYRYPRHDRFLTSPAARRLIAEAEALGIRSVLDPSLDNEYFKNGPKKNLTLQRTISVGLESTVSAFISELHSQKKQLPGSRYGV